LSDPVVSDIPFTFTQPDRGLRIETAVDARSEGAALLLHRAARNLRDGRADLAFEVERIPSDTLNRWSRESAPVSASVWRHADESDARTLWGIACLLLLVETFVRRRPAAVEEVSVRAA
jgi:hypothetical protein